MEQLKRLVQAVDDVQQRDSQPQPAAGQRASPTTRAAPLPRSRLSLTVPLLDVVDRLHEALQLLHRPPCTHAVPC